MTHSRESRVPTSLTDRTNKRGTHNRRMELAHHTLGPVSILHVNVGQTQIVRNSDKKLTFAINSTA